MTPDPTVCAELTKAEREALAAALRRCRVEDAPVRLIHESDIFHVVHMLKEPVERIVADRCDHQPAIPEETP